MKKVWVLGLVLVCAGCGQSEAVYQGKPTSYWVRQLRGSDAASRQEAVQALATIGVDSVPALIVALGDAAPETRAAAADVLGRIGPAAKGALPTLTATLKDTDKTVRQHAAFALGVIDPEDTSVVPALIELLKDSDLEVRRHAALSLGRLGPGARPALDALTAASKDADSRFRHLIQNAIRKINLEISATDDIDTSPPVEKPADGM
jgi:HEAT repeat protein